MQIIGVLVIVPLLSWLTYYYFSYALIDHLHPNSAPSLFGRVTGTLTVTLLGIATIAADTIKPELAPNLALVVMGTLILPAIAPPSRNEYAMVKEFPKWIKIVLTDIFSAQIPNKVFALLALGIVLLFDIENWFYVAPGLSFWLLWGKGAAIAAQEAKSKVVPPEILKKWTVRSLKAGTALMAVFVVFVGIVLTESQHSIDSWSVLVGVGAGSFIIGVSH